VDGSAVVVHPDAEDVHVATGLIDHDLGDLGRGTVNDGGVAGADLVFPGVGAGSVAGVAAVGAGERGYPLAGVAVDYQPGARGVGVCPETVG
jgi:hypothetical protein